MEKEMYLTNVGRAMMNSALLGQTVAFVGFSVGEGILDDPTEEDMKSRTSLVTPVPGLADIAITVGSEQGAYVKLKGSFSSQDDFDLPDARKNFVWRELGIYASGQGTQEFVGDGTTVSFVITNSTYMIYYVEETVGTTTTTVSTDDYHFDAATNALVFDTAPDNGTIIDVYFPDLTDKKLFAYGYDAAGNPVKQTDESSVAQSYEIDEVFSIDDGASIVIKLDATGNYVTIDEFNAHTNNYNNPHNVTASQIGITGDSGTSIVNDMKVSFTRASSLTNLTSPATLSSLFGKISKAVYDFINHKKDTNNPHKVSLKQAINQDSSSASPGVVPLSMGGTGVTSLAALQALVGGSANVVSGWYTGTGQYNSQNPRVITTFSSTPKLIVIFAMKETYHLSPDDPFNSISHFAVLQNGTPIPSGYTGYLQTCSCINGQFRVWTDEISEEHIEVPMQCDYAYQIFVYFAIL